MISNKLKLGVAVIWESPFMYSDCVDTLLDLDRPEDCDVKFTRGRGWSPACRHNNACEKLLHWGADLILILGADQVYEPDLLTRLVARFRQGYEVVSALVPCRGHISWMPMKPFQPMAYRFKYNQELEAEGIKNRPYRGMHVDAELIKIIKREDGDMQLINFIGSGVLMFHRDHLLALKRPWFKESVEPDGPTSNYRRWASMDTVFVWRLQHEGHARVYCDTTINVRHLNIFPVDDSFQDRFLDWKVDATALHEQGFKNVPLSALKNGQPHPPLPRREEARE